LSDDKSVRFSSKILYLVYRSYSKCWHRFAGTYFAGECRKQGD
jgi:hypothetical protein